MRRARKRFPTVSGLLAFATAFHLALPAAAVDWQPVIKTKTYAVSGATGAEIYEAIGRAGPVIKGGRRTIALTEWDLRWRRDYQQQENACVLASALPLVTITYTFPDATGRLDADLAAKWDRFLDGIIEHEHIHGALVVDLANRIRAATVGLRVEADPGCNKIRAKVQENVAAEFERYKGENAGFESREMRDGGNVHRLILSLVN